MVNIGFGEETYDEIKSAADRIGVPFAVYCRMAAILKARADLAQPVSAKPDWASET